MCHCGAKGEFDIVFSTGTISRRNAATIPEKKKRIMYIGDGLHNWNDQKKLNYVTLGMAYTTEMNQRKKQKEQAYQNTVQSNVFV